MKVVCSCGKTLQIPEALANKRVRCPYCSQSLVAGPAAPEAVPPEAASPDLGLGSGQPAAGPAPDDHLAALAAALGGAADSPPKAKASRPASAGQPATAGSKSAPAGKAAAVRPTSVPVPPALPAKRRDRTPLILLAVAGGVLLIVLIVVLTRSGDSNNKVPEQQVITMPSSTIEPATPSKGSGGGLMSFGVEKDNRTYADYLKEKAEKEQKNREKGSAEKSSSGK